MGLVVTVTGVMGAGNSSVAKMLAERLGVPSFGMGAIRKKFAEEKGMSLQEFNKYSETDPTSDITVDKYQQTLKDKHDSFVLDAKVGWYFYPDSVKVYLKVDLEEGAKRIMGAHRHVEVWSSVEEAIAAMKDRIRSDDVRYQNLYQAEVHNLEHYDIVIDTTHLTQEQVVQKIIDYLEEHKHIDKKTL